jgi:FKBP-type peptidyl-prolyl cis-trans isomerase SlyD
MAVKDDAEIITKNKVVEIHYILTGDDKQTIDASEKDSPLPYLHGYQQIVPGLEKALAGKKVGDKLTVEVSPEEGYGTFNEELVKEIEKDQFPNGSKIEAGEMFEASGPDGNPMIIRITEVKDDTVTIDGNHPLAGKNLFFDIEIVSIREATKEELEHGHAHHGDGHTHQ